MPNMKKVLIGLLLVFITAIGILSVMGGSVREIKTEVFIAAPADKVWATLTNFNDWNSWNPTVNLAQGDSSVGSKLNIIIRGNNGEDSSKYQPIVLESNPPNKFRWRAKMLANFVFKNDRVFVLESQDGGTLLSHSEEFSGIMVPLVWGMLKKFVEPTLEKMNVALKKKVEGEH